MRLQLSHEAPAAPPISSRQKAPSRAGSPGSGGDDGDDDDAGGAPPQQLAQQLYEAQRLTSCTVLVADLPGVPQGTFTFAAIQALLNNPVCQACGR